MSRFFRVELVETNDKGEIQTTKLLGYAGEELTDVHRISHFGVHSVAPKGSHGVGMQLSSSEGRGQVVALGLEHQKHRPRDAKEGETRLYDANGSVISLIEKEVRTVHAKQVVVAVGGCTLTITKDGFAFKGGKVSHEDRNIGSSHKHSDVQPGGGQTGVPVA